MFKNKPYLIAEISANHCGNFQLAKKLVSCAKKNGANAVKLQTYTANTMTIKSKKKYFNKFKGTEEFYKNTISLPIYYDLSKNDLFYIVKVIKKFIQTNQ